jgi:hypothetical protein
MMRKPDFVDPAGPEGGASAGEGRHGSIMPRPGAGTLTQRHNGRRYKEIFQAFVWATWAHTAVQKRCSSDFAKRRNSLPLE